MARAWIRGVGGGGGGIVNSERVTQRNRLYKKLNLTFQRGCLNCREQQANVREQQQQQQPLFVFIIINVNISWQGDLIKALLSFYK